MLDALIYKIATTESVENARKTGLLSGMPIDLRDGYIHFSTAAQIAETLRLHFPGQSGLVLLAVRVEELGDLRWEPSRGGQLFPHLYGTLPMTAVAHEASVSVSQGGDAILPDWVR